MKLEDPLPAIERQLAALVVARVRGWSQAHAAYFLGTDQARLSDLRHARLDRFSLEQLIRFVARAAGDVAIGVEWSTHSVLFRSWQRCEREQGPEGQLLAMLPSVAMPNGLRTPAALSWRPGATLLPERSSEARLTRIAVLASDRCAML